MYIGIFGGSFNPIHTGHMRMALEALEYTHLPPHPHAPSKVARIDIVPCAYPPHKNAQSLLPFPLRVKLLRAVFDPIRGITVNEIEGLRSEPSYTWHTLNAYKKALPDARLLFLLGGEDFSLLPEWYKGLELPQLADIGVVPRRQAEEARFCQDVQAHWPDARLVHSDALCYATTPADTRIIYLPLPRLDISASDIRSRWVAHRRVDGLLPEKVRHLLAEHNDQVTDCWQATPC